MVILVFTKRYMVVVIGILPFYPQANLVSISMKRMIFRLYLMASSFMKKKNLIF